MVLVVIFMHPVPSDQKKIIYGICKIPYQIKMRICPGIGRIGFRHTDDSPIKHIFFIDDPDQDELIDSKSPELFIILVP